MKKILSGRQTLEGFGKGSTILQIIHCGLGMDNIYLCLCSNSCGYVEEIIRRCPGHRLLFGSDGGFLPNLIELAIAKLRASDASPAVLRRIFHDNPQALLPLPEPARASGQSKAVTKPQTRTS